MSWPWCSFNISGPLECAPHGIEHPASFTVNSRPLHPTSNPWQMPSALHNSPPPLGHYPTLRHIIEPLSYLRVSFFFFFPATELEGPLSLPSPDNVWITRCSHPIALTCCLPDPFPLIDGPTRRGRPLTDVLAKPDIFVQLHAAFVSVLSNCSRRLTERHIQGRPIVRRWKNDGDLIYCL
jgi:hypothetical protein